MSGGKCQLGHHLTIAKRRTILERKSCRPIFDISIPSMTMRPLAGSTNRRRLIANVDLPLPKQASIRRDERFALRSPVLPSNPTRSPPFKVNDTSWRTAGRSGAYFTVRFSTEISAS